MNSFIQAIVFFITNQIIASEYIHYRDIDVWYKFEENPLSWKEAYFQCRSENASLAMPKNQEEADIIREMLIEKDIEYVLIGFHDLFTDGEHIYLDGRLVQYGFSMWQHVQENGGLLENCGALHDSGRLDDCDCDKPKPYICEKRDRKPVEIKKYRPDEAYKYWFAINKSYKLHMDARSWGFARTICKAEGGNLAIIRSKEEENILLLMLNDPNYRVTSGYAFLGFHDLFKKGHYITTEGEDIDKIGYKNWSYFFHNKNIVANCGAIDKSTGGIVNRVCGHSFIFFCERSHVGLNNTM